MAKELLPIVISTAIWGPSLSGNKVLYQWGNSSVVAAICKGSARYTIVMHLLCNPWLFIAHYDVDLVCEHIVGVANTTADHLSRNNNSLFCFFFAEYRCLIAANPTPSSSATNHQHPRFRPDISTLQSVIQSSSLHTQALRHRHPAIALLLSKH